MKIKKRNPIEIIHASCPGEQSNVVEIANVCVRGAHPPNRACEGFSEDAVMCSLKLPVSKTELAVNLLGAHSYDMSCKYTRPSPPVSGHAVRLVKV